MSHSYHDALPGFSEAQVLVTGCDECEYRSKNLAEAIEHMDVDSFARAWARATTWQHEGLQDISYAEVPLLRALWAMQLQLERRGLSLVGAS
jgi:hypothetical protein